MSTTRVVPMLENDESFLVGSAILERATKLGVPATLEDAEWMVAHPEQISPEHNDELLVFTGTIQKSAFYRSVPVLSRVSGQWKIYWTQLSGTWTQCFKLVVQ